MRLRARIGALTACGLVILVATGAAVGWQLADARAAAAEFSSRLQPASDSTDQLVIDVADLDRGLSNFVLTGKPTDQTAYAAAKLDSDRQLELLAELLSPRRGVDSHEPDFPSGRAECADSRLVIQLDEVVQSRSAWVSEVGTPTVAAMSANRAAAARAVYDTTAADERYRRVNVASTSLQLSVEACKVAAFTTMTDLSSRLLVALLISAGLLIIGLGLAFTLVRSWVLTPVDSLRFQLRRVTGERRHEAPITPNGPPEIVALGRDAEQMRRELVAESDEARAALEGLTQEGPTVTLVRSALDRPEELATTIATVFGRQQPAEGMLAGDWWDAIELADGGLAVALFDVSGHGPTAAIIGLKLKTLVMSALASGGVRELDMSAIAETFADAPASFATGVIMVFNRDASRIEWINAGHPAALLLHGDGSVESLRQTGPLLSSLGGRWSWRSLPLQSSPRAGDVVLAWTDGLTERRPPDSESASSSAASNSAASSSAASSSAADPEIDPGSGPGLAGTVRATTDAHAPTAAALVELVRARMSTSNCSARELGEVVLSAMRHGTADWRRDDVTLVVVKLRSG